MQCSNTTAFKNHLDEALLLLFSIQNAQGAQSINKQKRYHLRLPKQVSFYIVKRKCSINPCHSQLLLFVQNARKSGEDDAGSLPCMPRSGQVEEEFCFLPCNFSCVISPSSYASCR